MLTRAMRFRRSRRAVIGLNLVLSVPAWAAVIIEPAPQPVEEPTAGLRPIPKDLPIRKFASVAGTAASHTAPSATAGSPILGGPEPVTTIPVYDNPLSTHFLPVPSALPTALIADDIATTAANGCALAHYTVRVTGDVNGDGHVPGDLVVTTAIYYGCPRAGADLIGGSRCDFAIAAIDSMGILDLTCEVPLAISVPLATNFYLGIRFNRGDAGIAIGAPALRGFSMDRFDHPNAACGAGLGGFPAGPHASFYGKIFVREPCGDTFVGYKNTRQNERGFSPGAGVRFADDIRMNVPNGQCNMVGLEVGVKGSGACLFDLRTCLNADPENGCLIPGTRGGIAPTVNGVPAIGRLAFDPPIPIDQNLWVSFRTTSAIVGPIATGIQAGTGTTEDFYMVFRNGEWVPTDFTNAQTHAGFSVSITCDGLPPQGACCDMVLTDESGDSVCREGAEVNCPFPQLWEEDGRCGPVCVGGANDTLHCQTDADCPGVCIGGSQAGQPCIAGQCTNGTCSADCQGSFCVGGTNNGLACTRSTDCPGASCFGGSAPGQPCTTNAQCPNGGFCRGAECPGPFLDSCGESACCTYDDQCLELTERECNSYGDSDRTNLFQRGEFCNLEGQRCPFCGCFDGVGDCCENDFESRCTGGTNDGQPCDPFFPSVDCPGGNCRGGTTPGAICFPGGTACPGAGATCVRAECPGPGPGCDDPFCCSAVCEIDQFCCCVWWDDRCFEFARNTCDCGSPENDQCVGPESGDGALLLAIPSIYVGDGVHASESPTDPDFCCWEGPPDPERGTKGFGTLWYIFIAPPAPPGQTTSSMQVSTCGSNSPADNSLVEIFSIPDSDRGKCQLDLSVCSVSAQDCADGSECVFDEEFACSNLSVVVCEDDTPTCSSGGGIPQPQNSRICVTGLVPGDLYYIMLAGKTAATKADYRLQISANCGVTRPPIPNDLCGSATPLTDAPLSVPFDLSGGETYAPVTFDCPGPDCLEVTLHNDIWFDWTAPASGTATFSTCGEDDATTPDTGLVVYDGCRCPGDANPTLGCNDFQWTPCFLGAKVENARVIQGNCYKIRLGGHLGDTPSGFLSITMPYSFLDCDGNWINDACDLDCLARPVCPPGCGSSADCNHNSRPDSCDIADHSSYDLDCNRTPDECQEHFVRPEPPHNGTLPRLRENAFALTLSFFPITAPQPGEIEIREMLANGGYGPDLSQLFSFSDVDATLIIHEAGHVLESGRWYSIRNVGGWINMPRFEVHYAVVVGDADGSGVNDFADLTMIFNNLTGRSDYGSRFDINADGFVDFADISDAFAYNGSTAQEKPSGHECPK